ncbi:hypothetical protein N658DRAFT_5177 [Parathielavia hyrcaniae]|uniref:Uncharacterized protein n=1 Tax=Parathielavia hyrcaniae TaxID=113614 RepID=A0AAN6T6N8_9PEZI|nr:hypothetical protein N658DRAFT_5177 [Parathielavia hyrcaniae]
MHAWSFHVPSIIPSLVKTGHACMPLSRLAPRALRRQEPCDLPFFEERNRLNSSVFQGFTYVGSLVVEAEGESKSRVERAVIGADNVRARVEGTEGRPRPPWHQPGHSCPLRLRVFVQQRNRLDFDVVLLLSASQPSTCPRLSEQVREDSPITRCGCIVPHASALYPNMLSGLGHPGTIFASQSLQVALALTPF